MNKQIVNKELNTNESIDHTPVGKIIKGQTAYYSLHFTNRQLIYTINRWMEEWTNKLNMGPDSQKDTINFILKFL